MFGPMTRAEYDQLLESGGFAGVHAEYLPQFKPRVAVAA